MHTWLCSSPNLHLYFHPHFLCSRLSSLSSPSIKFLVGLVLCWTIKSILIHLTLSEMKMDCISVDNSLDINSNPDFCQILDSDSLQRSRKLWQCATQKISAVHPFLLKFSYIFTEGFAHISAGFNKLNVVKILLNNFKMWMDGPAETRCII